MKKKHVYEISINCEPNDPVDIRCGGPLALGFDFTIRTDESKEDIENFLKFTLKQYGRPLMSIQVVDAGAWMKRKMWTKKQMEECIKEGYE